MLRLALAALTILLLALPAVADGRVIEIGRLDGEQQLPEPSCPRSPCFAVSRTTGYQAKVGTTRGLVKVPANGRIVAWTIRLSRPGPRQIAFFNQRLGGAAQAQVAVLRTGRRLFGRVVAQTPMVDLEPFFGQTVQFPLDRTIPVKRGSIVALSVPTWAPALATGLGPDTSWRASRRAGNCDDTATQTAQSDIRDLAQYRCLYQRVRLTYSATLITEPKPNRRGQQQDAADDADQPQSG
jgi:hypothetical protein